MSNTEEYWIESYVPTTGNGFIDVGANLCVWTKWLAPGYKFVHAIEPFQQAIDAAGELPTNVTMHKFGAWSKDCNVHFGIYEPGNLLFAQEKDINSWFSEIGVNHPVDQKSLILPCKSLDSMVPEQDQIDFIKIDVEGAEYQVLLGATEIIKQSHPCMIVEIHSRLNAPLIEDLLRAQDYDLEVVRHACYDGNNPEHRAHWGNHYFLVCK